MAEWSESVENLLVVRCVYIHIHYYINIILFLLSMHSAHFESSIISPSCFGWSQSDTGLTYFSNIFLSIYIVYVIGYVWISTSSKKTTDRRPKMRINCWTSKKPKIWLLRIRTGLSFDRSQKLLLHPVALLRSILWRIHFNREVFLKSYFWKSYVNY